MNTENHGVSADEKRDLTGGDLIEDDTPPVIGDDGAEILSNRPRAMTGDEIGELLDSLASIAELCDALVPLVPMMLAGVQGVGKPAQRVVTPDGSGLTKRRG